MMRRPDKKRRGGGEEFAYVMPFQTRVRYDIGGECLCRWILCWATFVVAIVGCPSCLFVFFKISSTVQENNQEHFSRANWQNCPYSIFPSLNGLSYRSPEGPLIVINIARDTKLRKCRYEGTMAACHVPRLHRPPQNLNPIKEEARTTK